MAERKRRKVREGIVVSDRMDKTAVVQVERLVRHPLYRRVVRRTQRYHVHDPENQCGGGDLVRIMESRPLSKTKRWRLVSLLRKAE